MIDENSSEVSDISETDETVPDTNENTEEARTYKVKIDGVHQEIDEATLIKGYQLEQVANKRIEDSSKLYKNLKPYIPIVEALQKGDLSVLKKIGLKPEDIRKFSEQELQEYLDEQDMNPDQRALAETRIERDLLKAQTEQLNQKAVEDKREEEAQRAGERIDTEMRDALEGSKIPLKGNFKLVRRVAEDMYSQIEAGNVANASQSLTRVLVTRYERICA